MNENEDTPYQNSWDASKARLRWILIALSVHIKKEESLKSIILLSHLKTLGKKISNTSNMMTNSLWPKYKF